MVRLFKIKHLDDSRIRWLLAPLLGMLCFSMAQTAARGGATLPPLTPVDGLGVNIHGTWIGPGELEMMKAAGFKWIRADLQWNATEKEKGKYDFSAYDGLMAALAKENLHAILILDYGNPLYADPGDKQPFTSRVGTEEFRAAYAAWAAAAVSHFAGQGCIWEIWNEPDWMGFWAPKPNVAEYVALAGEADAAIKQAAPGEPIVGPAVATMNFDFLEACFRAGLLADWAAVSVHPYRHGDPESAADDYQRLRAMIAQYAPAGKTVPIICSEWGYSTLWKGFDEAKQAEFLTREFETNVKSGIPLSIWYDWREGSGDPTNFQIHFGLVHHDYHAGKTPVYDPKPAYGAMKAFAAGLAAGQAVGSGTGEAR
jgi:hypothetical protein